MINNPIYRLSCEISNCHFILYVNDIPIANSEANNTLSTVTSINQWLILGNNVITFFYWFDEQVPYSANTSGIFSLFNIDATDKFGKDKVILKQFSINPASNSSIKDKLTQVFKVDGNVFNNLLASLNAIKDISEVYNEAYKLYENVYECFAKKDIATYLKIADAKEHDYALVYFSSIQKRINETRALLDRLINDPENSLIQHPKKLVTFKLYFEGRLISVEDQEGNPALLFANFKNNTANFIPLYFGISKINNKMYLIR